MNCFASDSDIFDISLSRSDSFAQDKSFRYLLTVNMPWSPFWLVLEIL